MQRRADRRPIWFAGRSGGSGGGGSSDGGGGSSSDGGGAEMSGTE